MVLSISAPLNLACFVVYSSGLRLEDKRVLSLYHYMYNDPVQ
jgi:hypothetical protein